jgi:beta-phosphoglucomutase-like phosphatase (HAD superfamily)
MSRYAVDLDGVMFDANAAMLRAVNERFGTRYELAHMREYDWYAWSEREHARHALTSFRELVATMPWLPDAVDGLRRLDAAGGVTIITHRTPDLAAATAAALAGLPFRAIHHVDQAESKAGLALRLGCLVALEDSPAQAIAYADAGLAVYLFAYPYNAAIRHPRVRRVVGWPDVLAAEGL